MNPKKIGKNILCALLEKQVKRLRRKNSFKVVAVVGSIGKTSTKIAIAKTLGNSYRVIYQDGNYNDRLTVPLVIFGQTEPDIFNVLAWLRILMTNELLMTRAYPYSLAILELGTDGPGQLKKFAYLRPDILVVTAVDHEHMQFFQNLDAVAQEELSLINIAQTTLINLDNVSHKYLPKENFLSYGTAEGANYKLTAIKRNGQSGQILDIDLKSDKKIEIRSKLLGSQGAMISLAALAVADILAINPAETKEALEKLTPYPGRMQLLEGLKNTLLIDDTYNASPIAVKAALDVLYSLQAGQRIAVLGSMNELGRLSEDYHRSVGEYCDPAKLDLVVTIGQEAERYLAEAAKDGGCQVKSFVNPYEAGDYLKRVIKPEAIILFKGSQNGVFAEEALKKLLKNSGDEAKLVRQSAYWLKKKHQQLSF